MNKLINKALTIVLIFTTTNAYSANITSHLSEVKELFQSFEPKKSTQIRDMQDYRHDERNDVQALRTRIYEFIRNSEHNYDKAKAYQILAKTYVSGNMEKAAGYFGKACELMSECPEFYFTAGDAIGFNNKAFDIAIAYYNKAYDKINHIADKIYDLYVNNLIRNKKEVIKWERSLMRWYYNYYRSMGKLYRDVNVDLQKALEFYKKTFDLFEHGNRGYLLQNKAGICTSIAGVYYKLQRQEEAKGLEVSAKNYKNQVDVWTLKAMNYINTEEFANTVHVYKYIAVWYKEKGDINNAKEFFKKGLDLIESGINERDQYCVPVFYKEAISFYKIHLSKPEVKKIFEDAIKRCKPIYSYDTNLLFKEYALFIEEAANSKENGELSSHELYKKALEQCEFALEHAYKRNRDACAEVLKVMNRIKSKLR